MTAPAGLLRRGWEALTGGGPEPPTEAVEAPCRKVERAIEGRAIGARRAAALRQQLAHFFFCRRASERANRLALG